MADAKVGGVPLKLLKSTHPRVNLFDLRVLRALYRGGKDLLGDAEVMKHVFPQHMGEKPNAYKERCARAFYDPEFAFVVNKIVAGLAMDPVVFDDAGESEGKQPGEPKVKASKPKPPIGEPPGGPEPTAKAVTVTTPPKPKLDEYWRDLQDDATPPHDDGEAKPFDEVMNEAVNEALVSGWSWVLVDMPPKVEATSLADQEKAGALDAYPVPYTAMQVTNWEERDNKLRWVLTANASPAPVEWFEERKYTRHTWRIWDATAIITLILDLDKDGKDPSGRKWEDDDLVPFDGDPVLHEFKRVPWVCFDFAKPGEQQMHVGGMIESRCRSLFNEQCGETFQRFRHMFQQLYEFLGKEYSGPDEPISAAQMNEGRAPVNWRNRAPDTVQIRGADDEAKFVSPDMSGADINRQSLQEGRDAISRVTGQLAMQSDTSGAMVRRSGESKAQDKIAEEIVLGKIGKKKRACAMAVVELLAIGRGIDVDKGDKMPELRGAENFSVADTAAAVDEAVALSTVDIKSARFKIEHQFGLACDILGHRGTPDVRFEVREQLEAAITQDDVIQGAKPEIQFTPDGQPIDKSKGLEGVPPPLPEPKPPAKGGKK